MDYKYIEQLIEKYWACETSCEEEQILRFFFRQKEIPSHLMRYKSLFVYQSEEKEIKLGSDFDKKILAQIEKPVVMAKHISFSRRFMPLFKAAVLMIFLFSMGSIVKHSVGESKHDIVYVYDQYRDNACDPQVAYEGDSVKSILKTDVNKNSFMEK